MSVDKQPRPPLLTDPERWRRAIFDYPQQMVFQRMDDSLAYYADSINLNDKTLVLSKRGDKNAAGNLTFQRPAQDQLVFWMDQWTAIRYTWSFNWLTATNSCLSKEGFTGYRNFP